MSTSVLDRALGVPPFPWQQRLLGRAVAGDLPDALDLPTGVGKTSVMAIWLVALAQGANLPRRLVYVVDRRAVVDQATREAERLRAWLDGEARLKEALGLDGSLPISTLRGQFVDNREWLDDPTVPAIVVGTVDMIGSRLLFEGYACSRKMRPYHAGLLGADAWFVLDESHLVPPFEHMLREAFSAPGLRGPDAGGVVPPARLLSLSATGGGWHSPFRLDSADLAHPVIRQRVRAPKRIVVHEGPVKDLAAELADRAWALIQERPRSRVAVFCTKRDVAQKVADTLKKRFRAEKWDSEAVTMLVGARRVHERERAAEALRRLGFLAGSDRFDGSAVLVATSAGEVGVDLDADHAVCDLVAWERMVQRLGRVNRRGEGDAEVHVVVGDGPDPKKQADLHRTWQAARMVVDALPEVDGGRDGSAEGLETLKWSPESAELVRAATTPEPLHPALTLPLVEAWAMTSLKHHTGRPTVGPWLRGWVGDEPQTSVSWRRWLPTASVDEALTAAFFEAAPPHLAETLEAPTHVVAAWLLDRVKAVRRAEGAPGGSEPVAFILDASGVFEAPARTLDSLDPAAKNARERLFREIAGRQLVVDARLAGLSPDGLLDAKEADPPTTLEDDELQGTAADPRVPYRVQRFIGVPMPALAPWRRHLVVPLDRDADDEVTEGLAVDRWRTASTNEDDRSASRLQGLAEHQSWAEEEAERIGRRLDLSDDLRRVLMIAARLHDEGKRAKKWQSAFSAPSVGGPFAKTPGPVRTRVLDGYRHEFGSLPRAAEDPAVAALSPDARDLVLHLIAAHHGFARPTISPNGCEDAPPTALTARAGEVALRYAALQERWGPWGLAWLETLLRAADQRASKRNDEVSDG